MKNHNTVTIAKKALSTLVLTSSFIFSATQTAAANEQRAASVVAQDIESVAMQTLEREGMTLDKMVEEAKLQKVNINLASFEQLVSLPGIGKVKASAIIAYRKEVGMFKVLEDLQNIKGIGEKLFAKLQPKIKI